MKTTICPDCDNEISNNNFKKHLGSKTCENNQKNNNRKPIIIQEDWLLPNGKYQCPHCEKEYTKNGIGTHIWRTHSDGQNFTANNDALYKNGKPNARKGLTKENDKKTLIASLKFKEKYRNGEIKLWGCSSEEHRKSISKGMKRAHSEGRAHNIGQSRWNNEMSYPEKFFKQVIENEFLDKNFIQEYNVSIFSIDFAWVDKKLAIEIDGEQHEKPDYKARDKRKDTKLKSEGWKVLRIKWKDLYNDTKEWIKIAKNFVDNVE